MSPVSFTANADAVLRSGIMDAASDIAELMSLQDEGMHAYLIGRYEGDCVMVESLSRDPEGAVGLCVSDVEGGTAPMEDAVQEMASSFQKGVLMVIDPYACEIAFYRIVDGGPVSARVLVTE